MHVTREHHRRVVYILGGAILVLLTLLVGAVVWFGYMKPQSTTLLSDPEAYLSASHGGVLASPFLQSEEAVVISTSTEENAGEEIILPVQKVLFEYVEVTDGCGTHFEGECLNVRSGPGTNYPVVARLRNGIVLKVGGKVEHDGQAWYKIVFDEWLRYPERITTDWYVSADHVKVLLDQGDRTVWNDPEDVPATSTKEILVDRAKQTLYAYDDGVLFMETPISTGLELTPTPRGTFTVFKKTPSRYMQGPVPGVGSPDDFYDLPGVPWNLYFTQQGAVIHGAYWHNSFGKAYSHGCVNLPLDMAKKLYDWADLGTRVIVKD